MRPSTLTQPAAIQSSASRREATPRSVSSLEMRRPSPGATRGVWRGPGVCGRCGTGIGRAGRQPGTRGGLSKRGPSWRGRSGPATGRGRSLSSRCGPGGGPVGADRSLRGPWPCGPLLCGPVRAARGPSARTGRGPSARVAAAGRDGGRPAQGGPVGPAAGRAGCRRSCGRAGAGRRVRGPEAARGGRRVHAGEAAANRAAATHRAAARVARRGGGFQADLGAVGHEGAIGPWTPCLHTAT
jgi:hypothetical protein